MGKGGWARGEKDDDGATVFYELKWTYVCKVFKWKTQP